MTYCVSLQRYWHDEEGRTCIELVADFDSISPGCLAGSIEEFDNPVDAGKRAVELQEENPEYTITLANAMIYGNPDDDMTVDEVIKWAERHYNSLAKCDRCGEIAEKESWSHEHSDDERFCSENCAHMDYEDVAKQMVELETEAGFEEWNK